MNYQPLHASMHVFYSDDSLEGKPNRAFYLAVIRGLRPLIDSILMNLISNAIKYRHPDRSPVIILKTSMKEDYVCLEVSDNGLGMDMDLYGEKLFTLYGRFHSHVDGKGLGLYLVKTHVMAMGGMIEAEGVVDQGMKFSVFFRQVGLPAGVEQV